MIIMDIKSSETKTVSQPKGLLATRIVTVIFTVIEVILAFRLVFKALGANPDNGFVRIVYGITRPFVGIFDGIFSNVSLGGASAVLESSTLIALIVVGIAAWILLTLLKPSKVVHTEKGEVNEQAI